MSGNRWFRFYNEVLNDVKVQRLSPNLFRTWVNLLCLASDDAGKLPSVDDIAFKLRMSVQDAQQQVDDLVLAGLIDITSTGLAPHNWKQRQFVSDTSTERVRKHRKIKAETQCNVSETADATPPDTESDTDTDSETEDKPVRSEQVAAHAKADGAEEILGLNGSTAEIVNGIAKFLNVMAPDRETARRIVASNVGLYGSDAVRDGYAELMADVADNKVRVPSVKALLGYFKTAGDRKARPRRDQSNRPQWAVERDAKIAAFTEALKTYQ